MKKEMICGLVETLAFVGLGFVFLLGPSVIHVTYAVWDYNALSFSAAYLGASFFFLGWVYLRFLRVFSLR